MQQRAWILALLVAFAAGCATTTNSAVRVPVSDCTSRCHVFRHEAQLFACYRSCPGAILERGSCSPDEPAEIACARGQIGPRPEDVAAAEFAVGLIEILIEGAAHSHAHRCPHH
jgi:hypothetical protein